VHSPPSGLGSSSTRTPQQHEKALQYAYKITSNVAAHAISIFSDGSCDNHVGHAGSGTAMFEKCVCVQTFSDSFGPFSTNATGEIYAILRGLRNLRSVQHNSPIAIFTDSRYALSVLQNLPAKESECAILISKQVKRLNLLGCEISAFWIPAHVGHPGNELADSLAKDGLSLAQQGRVNVKNKVPFSVIKSITRQGFLKEWNRRWQLNHRNSMLFAIRPVLSKSKDIFTGSRQSAALRTRLRLQHCALQCYFKSVNLSRDEICRFCDQREIDSVFHFLCECDTFTGQRRSMFLNIRLQLPEFSHLEDDDFDAPFLLCGPPLKSESHRIKMAKILDVFIESTSRFDSSIIDWSLDS
jgi:ribonuclease HI